MLISLLFKRQSILFATVLLAALFIASNTQAAEDGSQKQLNALQEEIASQKLTIANVSKKRSKLEAQLRKDDLAISNVIGAIQKTTADLATTQKMLLELAKEKQTLSQKKQQQEAVLAQQIRAAYSSGHHDYLKLILNQEETKDVQRTVTYYQYLNRARIKEIDKFQETMASLLEVTTQHQEKQTELAELKVAQTAQKKTLQTSKNARAKTIKSLSQELLSSQQQLAKLEAEENNLKLALEKLAAAASAELSLNGLKKLRNKLRWPVKGRISHRFGTQKQGYLKWKGVLLSAPVGRQVNAVHNGKVLFSDWLKGYGLVTVIDHGDGYMSLYGHNQTLLKSVGDRVETGEPIALVGQSGGQQKPGLYFEIRHQGKAMNPKLWCK